MKYSIITAESSLGVHIDGSDKGPLTVIKSMNLNAVRTVPEPYKKTIAGSVDNINAVNKFNEVLYNNVRTVIKEKKIPITIGGDHSIAIGSALGSISENPNIGIIWIDSHGDYNTFETTITGNIHGLPFAAITGYGNKNLVKYHNNVFFNPKNSVLVGARDLDDLEKLNLIDAGITIFTTDDIKKYGIESIMNKAFKIANSNANGIHVSYDVDVIDPLIARGVSVKASNGINLKEAYELADIINNNINLIKSIDLVEYNPNYDNDFNTLEIVKNILNKIMK